MNQETQERLNAEITRSLGEALVTTISLRVQLEAAHNQIQALLSENSRPAEESPE